MSLRNSQSNGDANCVMPFKVAGVSVRSHDEKGGASVIHNLCSEGVFVDFQRNKH